MTIRVHLLVLVGVLALLAGACARQTPVSQDRYKTASPSQPTRASMGAMPAAAQSGNLTPPVAGFYGGGEVLFIHTEASDPQVASMLTQMMGPQVVLVPSLAQAPKSLLADVYVFTNGVKGGGPFGFQPDVFDSVPGEPGYSPLRAVNLVTWNPGAAARELRSLEQVKAAESKGEVKVTRPGAVVNMPMLTWPGGHR
jgi:hypothetical protein